MSEVMRKAVWESDRDWAVMRPFVYYQRENLIPEGLVAGSDVIDFSAGLGDLSAYVSTLAPSNLMATAPEEHATRPPMLPPEVEWRPGVGAGEIIDRIGAESADLIMARMVIQFPTVEEHAVDVDEILRQMAGVLRDEGSIVITTHAFFSLPQFEGNYQQVGDYLAAVEDNLTRLINAEDPVIRDIARETAGLIELVRYLRLPPREGPFGQTGFGLKIPMLVNSFIGQGFTINSVEVIEPFTFPIGLKERLGADPDAITALGEQVISIKHRYLTSVAAIDPYQRPAVLRSMIAELRELLPMTAVPIVRVHATKT